MFGYQVGELASGVADNLRRANHRGFQRGGSRSHDSGLGVGEQRVCLVTDGKDVALL